LFNRCFGFSRKPHHEQAFGAEFRRLNPANGIPHIVQRHAGFVAGKHVRIGRFDPQRHHQAARRLEHPEQFIVRVAHAHGAVEVHAQRKASEFFAQLHDTFPVGGKQVIVDVDVAHAEPVAQIFHVFIDVGRRVVAEALLKNGAIAVGALIHAAAGGDHRRAGNPDVAEKRQVVVAGKSAQLFVSRKRQAVEVGNMFSWRVGNGHAVFSADQSRDF